MKNSIKKFSFMFAIVALMLLLVACGNGNGTEDPDTSDNGAAVTTTDSDSESDAPDTGGSDIAGHVQGVTDTRIYVANSAATSGQVAGVGVPFLAGMDAYFRMVNESGGIHGREIVRLHTDDGFEGPSAIAALETFLYDDEVFALVGHFGSTPIGATWDMIVESRIPAVYFAGGIGVVYNEEATDGNGRNTFPIQPVFPMEGRVFLAWAVGTFDAETIAVIYTNDDAGHDFRAGVTQEAQTLGIYDNVHFVQTEVAVPDVTAPVATALGHDPDVIIAGSIQHTIRQIVNELGAQGNTAPVLTSYVNADITVAADIFGFEGQFDVFASSWVDMSYDMTDYQYWVDQVSGNEDFSVNSFAMTGWIAGHFFAEGLRRTPADNINWETFIRAMEEAPIQNPFGPAVDFSNGNRVGTQDLSLLRLDSDAVIGWEFYLPFMNITEILGE